MQRISALPKSSFYSYCHAYIIIYRYGVLDGLCARGICFVLVSGRGTIGHCSAYDSSWLSGE